MAPLVYAESRAENAARLPPRHVARRRPTHAALFAAAGGARLVRLRLLLYIAQLRGRCDFVQHHFQVSS
eukprot:4981909-Lingulodinium_polyedra.AAC.1